MAPPISKVWSYFIKKNDKHATCKKCFKDVKYCGNTSNLHKHTKYHGIVLRINEKKNSKNDVVDNSDNVLR